jgi:hypothetical protein
MAARWAPVANFVAIAASSLASFPVAAAQTLTCPEAANHAGCPVSSADGGYNYAAFSLVAEKKQCSGAEIHKGKKQTLEACADDCRGESTFFAYGRYVTRDCNVFLFDSEGNPDCGRMLIGCDNQVKADDSGCDEFGCECYCEVPGTTSCNEVFNSGYSLYQCASTHQNSGRAPDSELVLPLFFTPAILEYNLQRIIALLFLQSHRELLSTCPVSTTTLFLA